MNSNVRIDSCHYTLPRSLFIASSTIDLSCKEEMVENLRFQRMF